MSLAALRVPDERILALLTERLEYDLTEGAIYLGLYGDPAARPALERVLAEEDDAHLKGLLQDASEQLGRGPDKEEPFDITTYFEDRVPPPSEVLEEKDLREMLRSSDPEYRFAAAAAFAQAQPGDAAVEEILDHAANDEDPRVRGKCWQALSELSEDKDISDAMLQRLRDESAPKIERAGALIGLGQVAGEEPVRKYAEELYKDPETRAAALAAMWNSLDRSFASYFPQHLNDADPEVRKQAISGVGYLGIHDAAERLREMFDEDEYRPNALFAYALCARAEVSPSRMRALLRRIEDFAGGLDEDEKHLVELALDERLLLNGHKPVFHPDSHDDEPEPEPAAAAPKPGRNDPCPCGSGKKYKKCHGG
jgi:HEAT repeat protein